MLLNAVLTQCLLILGVCCEVVVDRLRVAQLCLCERELCAVKLEDGTCTRLVACQRNLVCLLCLKHCLGVCKHHRARGKERIYRLLHLKTDTLHGVVALNAKLLSLVAYLTQLVSLLETSKEGNVNLRTERDRVLPPELRLLNCSTCTTCLTAM